MECKEVKIFTNSLECLSSYLSPAVKKALSVYKNLAVGQTYRNKLYQAYLFWSSRDEKMHLEYANILGLPNIFSLGNHKTYTLRSLHTIYCAVDLYFIDGNKKIINDKKLYNDLYNFFLQEKVPVVWGGFLRNNDYGHFELALSDSIKEKLFSGSYDLDTVDRIIKESLQRKKYIFVGNRDG
jgi:hypothetical protein